MRLVSLFGIGVATARTSVAGPAQQALAAPSGTGVSKVLERDQWLVRIDRRLGDGQEYSFVRLLETEPDDAELKRLEALAESLFQRRSIELFG